MDSPLAAADRVEHGRPGETHPHGPGAFATWWNVPGLLDVTGVTWSAAQYLLFERERTRPVRDLLAAVPTAQVRSAVDLGCGPGNSTELLAQRCPGAAIMGLDSSADMIAAARLRLPQVRFEQGDIATWRADRPVDLVLSNAALQWVPDHAGLLPRLLAGLAPGGSLAVQVPDTLDEPAERLMREVATDDRWAGRLGEVAGKRTALRPPAWYYGLLRPHCARVDMWRTVYHHALPGGADGVVAWFMGSALRPFLAPLDAAEQADFLDRYRRAVARVLPAQVDGTALLPMPRLFIVATRQTMVGPDGNGTAARTCSSPLF